MMSNRNNELHVSISNLEQVLESVMELACSANKPIVIDENNEAKAYLWRPTNYINQCLMLWR